MTVTIETARYPSLKDRTAFITGGGSGIGAASAALLRLRGAEVVTVDLEGGDITADVRDPTAIETAVDVAAARLGGPADILVAAAGVPGMIQPEHVNPGGVVVGAGVQYEGRTLLPDVDEACEEVAGRITPRVGGVGPTTIALLFRNFVEAAERHARAA